MDIREDELLVTAPQRPAARLKQRHDSDDPDVRDRASARGESWVSRSARSVRTAR